MSAGQGCSHTWEMCELAFSTPLPLLTPRPLRVTARPITSRHVASRHAQLNTPLLVHVAGVLQ